MVVSLWQNQLSLAVHTKTIINECHLIMWRPCSVKSLNSITVNFFFLVFHHYYSLKCLKKQQTFQVLNETKNPETSWLSHVPTAQWIPHHQPAEAGQRHSAEPLGWWSVMTEVLESLPHPWASTCPAAPVLALPLVVGPSWHILRILSRPK